MLRAPIDLCRRIAPVHTGRTGRAFLARRAWPEWPARIGAAGCLVLALAACGPAPAPPRTWPAGTVLALNDVPISADEVDAIAAMFARIEPQDVLPQLRRIAVTNVVFPRAIARELAPERRAHERERAQACKQALDAGRAPEGSLSRTIEGGYSQIGLEAWAFALDAAPGRWSDVIETVGAFEIARVITRKQTSGGAIGFAIELHYFPYIDEDKVKTEVEARLDRSKLVFVDDTWREVVPTAWQYRLRGGSS